ncbi:hypothetical protein [Polynucleobacter sp.]|uniref:hypothetical protein n=1 Tax=Polynucleobacter sp. TaxID=2029855 RepID=UPI003F69F18B
MVWTTEKLIKNPVKFPIRRLYVKRRSTAGVYESTWQRIDVFNGVGRVINHGSVNIKIDSDKIAVGSFDIDDYTTKLTNSDGFFNAESDYRSFWNGYLDHKDTLFKIDVAMFDEDFNEFGTVTAFLGVIQEIDSRGDDTATMKIGAYSKKLNDYLFSDLGLSGNKTVSQILTAIFADARVDGYFGTTTLSPVNNITIDVDTNDVFKSSMWDVIKFIAKKSQSTAYVFNDTFYFGTRNIVTTTPEFTFAGLGNTQDDRAVTVYGNPTYDQSGADKWYTKIIDSSSGLSAESLDPIALNSGKTLTIDLTDVTTSPEKQDILDSYLDFFGSRRPSLKFTCPFMMLLVLPLDIINIDAPGARTEINSGYYDAAFYDSDAVYDGDGSSSSIDVDDRWIIEAVTYDADKWETVIFCRKQI